ncbi:MAG: hypothetical protein HY808_03110 [Nitrospirae bacterium]|nr:hypothetical protein [Nitrospirota bacterium]
MNWRTTLFGGIAALGGYLNTLPDPTLSIIGQIMSMLGTGLLGFFAADKKNLANDQNNYRP